MTLALILAALAAPQEAPAQPQSALSIARGFQSDSENLYQGWLKERPEALRKVGLGAMGVPLDPDCVEPEETQFIQFIECRDIRPPRKVKVDVRANDSVLYPFIGLILVETSELCARKILIPPKKTWAENIWERVQAGCLGRTYEDCANAGAVRPASKGPSRDCTGAARIDFEYRGELALTYRWTHERWEFEREDAKETRRLPKQP